MKQNTVGDTIWHEVLDVALMGTQRQQLSAEVLGECLPPAVATKEPAEALAQAVVVRVFMRRAAKSLQKLDEKKFSFHASPPENLMSNLSVLRFIFEEKQLKILPECLRLLHQHNLKLPPKILPDVFDYCLSDDAFVPLLAEAAGERGRWLANLNPAWQKIFAEPTQTDWEAGTKKMRLAYLKRLRQASPMEVVSLLEKTFADEGYAQKGDFLKVLQFNLSIYDESFLELCLANGNKDTQVAAIELLSKLPHSRWVQRQMARAKRVFRKNDDDGQLEVWSLDDDAASIHRLEPKNMNELAAAIPPSFWDEQFLMPKKSLLILFEKNNILNAVFESIIRFKAVDWATALVEYWSETQQSIVWETIQLNAVFDLLPESTFGEVASRIIKSAPLPLPADSPISKFLQENETLAWSESLTFAFFTHTKEWLAVTPPKLAWSGWHLKNILKRSAYLMSSSLYETLNADWETPTFSMSDDWQQEMEGVFKILSLRARIKYEIEHF